VSQPYKLTPEEARERRERLCTLEAKFHQSVAELKNAEGVKQQGIDGRLEAATAGLDASSGSAASGTVTGRGGGGPLGLGGGGGAGLGGPGAGGASFAGVPSFMGGASAGGDMNNSQYLEELAFQDSMLRLRAQQQQQQQQQQNNLQQQQNNFNQQQQQGGAGGPPQGGAGSYVDPILGSLALSQNTMNTTPLAASQYWRRQALLEASSHMDSLRMAQAGAIGIQRPVLEPGGLRDLRVPANLSLQGYGGDDSQQNNMQQHMQNNNGGDSYGNGKEPAGASGFNKKRKGNDFGDMHGNNNHNDDMAKRVRRAAAGGDEEAAAARNMPSFQNFGY